MKYNVTLEATVEAESAETAEQMVFGALAGCADDIGTKVVPAKESNVSIELTPLLTWGRNRIATANQQKYNPHIQAQLTAPEAGLIRVLSVAGYVCVDAAKRRK